jgi:thiol-disulfide isomerase/thioredoxin
MLQKHEALVKEYLETAALREKLVGKPSVDWSTTDLEGNPHALKDYRGKVVVLDFWYRGCGWCILGMPQIKDVAAQFQGKPVAVLGMNDDEKEDDATLVVQKLGLTYPNLKAKGLPDKYEIEGFPTLLILDQQGIVREVHVGYSPTLGDDVIKIVEHLLGG